MSWDSRKIVRVKPHWRTCARIQETDEYTSSYALKVPKIVRFRPDKKIEEVESVVKLHKLCEMQYERHVF